MTTSARFSRTRIAVHGSTGASVSVVESPEGAVGFNELWTIPGEEHVMQESHAEHVARGEYIYRRPETSGAVWASPYQYKQETNPTNHARQLQDFLRAIAEDREPLVNGEEGRKSLELMHAIYESGRSGRAVGLPLTR